MKLNKWSLFTENTKSCRKPSNSTQFGVTHKRGSRDNFIKPKLVPTTSVMYTCRNQAAELGGEAETESWDPPTDCLLHASFGCHQIRIGGIISNQCVIGARGEIKTENEKLKKPPSLSLARSFHDGSSESFLKLSKHRALKSQMSWKLMEASKPSSSHDTETGSSFSQSQMPATFSLLSVN